MNEVIQYRSQHDVTLQQVMRGGAGHCASCGLFVQAKGVEPPKLDAHIQAKRDDEQAAKAAKLKRTRSKRAPGKLSEGTR